MFTPCFAKDSDTCRMRSAIVMTSPCRPGNIGVSYQWWRIIQSSQGGVPDEGVEAKKWHEDGPGCGKLVQVQCPLTNASQSRKSVLEYLPALLFSHFPLS